MDSFLVFVGHILGVTPETLSGETAYGDLPEWDSAMHLRLIMEVESEYGVDIPLDKISEIKNLNQLYQFSLGK